MIPPIAAPKKNAKVAKRFVGQVLSFNRVEEKRQIGNYGKGEGSKGSFFFRLWGKPKSKDKAKAVLKTRKSRAIEEALAVLHSTGSKPSFKPKPALRSIFPRQAPATASIGNASALVASGGSDDSSSNSDSNSSDSVAAATNPVEQLKKQTDVYNRALRKELEKERLKKEKKAKKKAEKKRKKKEKHDKKLKKAEKEKQKKRKKELKKKLKNLG